MASVRRLPQYTREDIDRADAVFRDPDSPRAQLDEAVTRVADWRTDHYRVILLLSTRLSGRILAFCPRGSLVAARLKRIPTIIAKLRRPVAKKFTLWEMQDVAGVRVIVNSAEEAAALSKNLVADPIKGFKLDWVDNYYDRPQRSGYRAIHHIYTEIGDPGAEKALRVELQIRSRLQHTWATTEEIVGTFRGEALKSQEGDPDWLRFFSLVGTMIARKEHLPAGKNVPNNPADVDAEMIALREKLGVEERLKAFKEQFSFSLRAFTAVHPRLGTGRYFVLEYHVPTATLKVMPFDAARFVDAANTYRLVEHEHFGDSDWDIVLVSTEPPTHGDSTTDAIDLLEEAYPNYFVMTGDFLSLVYNEVG